MGTAIKHPVPDQVKPSFVIWAIWRSWLSIRVWCSAMSVRVPRC